jgi:hypothetical protein
MKLYVTTVFKNLFVSTVFKKLFTAPSFLNLYIGSAIGAGEGLEYEIEFELEG